MAISASVYCVCSSISALIICCLQDIWAERSGTTDHIKHLQTGKMNLSKLNLGEPVSNGCCA